MIFVGDMNILLQMKIEIYHGRNKIIHFDEVYCDDVYTTTTDSLSLYPLDQRTSNFGGHAALQRACKISHNAAVVWRKNTLCYMENIRMADGSVFKSFVDGTYELLNGSRIVPRSRYACTRPKLKARFENCRMVIENNQLKTCLPHHL